MKRLVLSAVTLVLVLFAAATARLDVDTTKCPPNFVYSQSTDSCYYFSSTQANQREASLTCASLNSSLVFINSAVEQSVIKDYLNTQLSLKSGTIWSGTCYSRYGRFSCSPENYGAWAPNNPSGDGVCVSLDFNDGSWTWNDLDCNTAKNVLCETNAYNPRKNVNLALKQPSFQQNTYENSNASLANDGVFNGRSLSCTLGGDKMWWAVDLGQTYPIGTVVVVNDPNPGAVDRLTNFYVKLSNVQPTAGQPLNEANTTLCAQYGGSFGVSTAATVFCQRTTQQFRYVIVQGSSTNPICLTEVLVYSA